MITNVQNALFRNGEENEKVIGNPHVDPDHHRGQDGRMVSVIGLRLGSKGRGFASRCG